MILNIDQIIFFNHKIYKIKKLYIIKNWLLNINKILFCNNKNIFNKSFFNKIIILINLACVVAEMILGEPIFPGESSVD